MLVANDFLFDDVLDRGLRPVFQPIVALDDGALVGFEALARGPHGHPLERPDALFAAARSADRSAEVCWRCQATAVDGARRAGLRDRWLFVNIEPATLGTSAPPEARVALAGGARDLRLVAELTERAITDAPADLLAAVRRLRAEGWAIALDDVGADARSLAMLPIVRPDVVKLDRGVVQGAATSHAARVMAAVNAYAEASGATILAEGIEDAGHERAAVTLGAVLGQGWRFGRPEPTLDRDGASAPATLAPEGVPDDATGSPFAVAAARRPVRHGDHAVLAEISRNLERQAVALDGPCVVAASFERTGSFDARTARRYATLAREASLVAVLARDMPAAPAPGVRGVRLAAGDPLADEWVVAVLGPHFAGALVARRDGDDDFAFVLTYDRAAVVAVTSAALMRVTA